MAVPKRKTSKSKIGSRRGSHRRRVTATHTCSQCGGAKRPHRVCPSCGYYRDRQVVSVGEA